MRDRERELACKRRYCASEKGRETQRRYNASEAGREARRRYALTQKGKAAGLRGATVWVKANPEKRRAHQQLMWAISTGRLKRQPCEVCGAEKADAHHEDYSQPLVIRFLCRRHHLAAHKEKAA